MTEPRNERERQTIALVKAALQEVGMSPDVWVDAERKMLMVQPVPPDRIDDVRKAAELANELLDEVVVIEEMEWFGGGV